MKFPHCKAVLFDLDGTLLDTAPDFVTALNGLLVAKKRPELSPDIIRLGVTHGSGGLITLGFNLQPGDKHYEPLREELLHHYRQCLTQQTSLFPGMVGILAELEKWDIPWGIVTNKPSEYTQPIMDSLNLTPKPVTIICPDHVSRTKPHPEAILLACKQLGISPAQSIYIGDHKRDIEAGNNAGSRTIAAAYGYLDPEENPHNWGADHVINTVKELYTLLF